MASRPYFGAILGHFEPFLARLGLFLAIFWPFGWGATAPSVSGPPKVGVKWGGESKLVSPEDPSGV